MLTINACKIRVKKFGLNKLRVNHEVVEKASHKR